MGFLVANIARSAMIIGWLFLFSHTIVKIDDIGTQLLAAGVSRRDLMATVGMYLEGDLFLLRNRETDVRVISMAGKPL